MSFIIIIPTYNAVSAGIERLLQSIKKQSIQPEKICIIDSSSTDNTVEICRKYSCEIIVIDKSSFNHGLTRQMGIDNNKNYDYAVFMTQDILLKGSNTLETLLSSFNHEDVSIAYSIAKPFAMYLLSGYSITVQENIAMFIGMVIFTGLNYLSQRFIVFR